MVTEQTNRINSFRARDDGSTITEYAILASLIAVALLVVVVALAEPVAGLFTASAEAFD